MIRPRARKFFDVKRAQLPGQIAEERGRDVANREITDRQRGWLNGELTCWHALGLVSSDQVARILELYGTPEDAAERRGGAVFTLTSLAALLVGLAVLLLVGYNWESMPAAVKLAVIFVVLAGHACPAGSSCAIGCGTPTASEVAFFLACLFYGAAIWLVGQIFHINAGDADGFWWWAVGVLPFALASTPCSSTCSRRPAGALRRFRGFSALLGAGGWLGFLGLPANGGLQRAPAGPARPGLGLSQRSRPRTSPCTRRSWPGG